MEFNVLIGIALREELNRKYHIDISPDLKESREILYDNSIECIMKNNINKVRRNPKNIFELLYSNSEIAIEQLTWYQKELIKKVLENKNNFMLLGRS